jgi:hypothetical protein
MPLVVPYGETVAICPGGHGAGCVSVVGDGAMQSGAQLCPCGGPQGPYVGGFRGPMGVAHTRLTVRCCVPEVDPYGDVDATWPGGHGAAWLCVVETDEQAGAHDSTGAQGPMLTTEEPKGPIGVKHAWSVVTLRDCGHVGW